MYDAMRGLRGRKFCVQRMSEQGVKRRSNVKKTKDKRQKTRDKSKSKFRQQVIIRTTRELKGGSYVQAAAVVVDRTKASERASREEMEKQQ